MSCHTFRMFLTKNGNGHSEVLSTWYSLDTEILIVDSTVIAISESYIPYLEVLTFSVDFVVSYNFYFFFPEYNLALGLEYITQNSAFLGCRIGRE